MNLDLAAMYGTPGAESAIEEQEKIAQAELFAKLAADNGIDLNQLGDEQIAELWDGTFGKTAGDDKDEDDKKGRRASEDDDEDDKSKKAAAEFYAVKEAHDKVAEADYLGRVMAHSFTNEMGEINGMGKTAKKAPAATSGFLDKAKEYGGSYMRAMKGEGQAASKPGYDYANAAQRATHKRPPNERELAVMGIRNKGEFDQSVSEARKKHYGEVAKTWGARGGTAAGLVGAGAGIHSATRSKESSALDSEAAEYAFQKAAEAGWDVNEASERLTAVLTLGPLESEKIASASTYGEALEVRSLELLAQAGYPVQWA